MFDYYSPAENIRHYRQAKPRLIDLTPLKTLGVPVSLFVGRNDILATTKDCRRIHEWLGPDTVHLYSEFTADHLSLVVGKDMTYFTTTAMSIIKQHQPL